MKALSPTACVDGGWLESYRACNEELHGKREGGAWRKVQVK